MSFHLFLFIAILAASVHVLNPISHLSLSTVLLQVSLGRPLFLFPSGADVSWYTKGKRLYKTEMVGFALVE